MGTINYYTSDYITLGVKPFDYDEDVVNELIKDPEHVEECAKTGYTVRECYEMSIQAAYDTLYESVKSELQKCDFQFYNVSIKPGYYEGFTIDIENNYGVFYDWWFQRREAQKEITQLKKFLLACADIGLVQCHPGWCTGYEDYEGTIKGIKNAIKEMRQEVQATPTYEQFEREEAKCQYRVS